MFTVSASSLCTRLFVLVAFVILGSDVSAEGFSYQLPPDGSWVRYEMQLKGTGKRTYPAGEDVPEPVRNAPPLPIETNGSISLSSAGTDEVNGEHARWPPEFSRKSSPASWQSLPYY